MFDLHSWSDHVACDGANRRSGPRLRPPSLYPFNHLQVGCRPLRGGVDRNLDMRDKAKEAERRPLRGGVDRNLDMRDKSKEAERRPLRGGVDRNHKPVLRIDPDRESPPSRGRG